MIAALRSLSRMPFVRDLATLQVGRVVYMGLTFVSSILLVRLLGLEQFGVYAVVVSFVGTIKTFLIPGHTSALSVFLAEAYGRKDKQAMGDILYYFFLANLCFVLLLFSFAILARPLGMQLYGSREIGVLAVLLILFQALDTINSFTLIVLQSVRSIRLKVVMEQSAMILVTLLPIIWLLIGGGLRGVFVGQLVASALFVPLSIIVFLRMSRSFDLPSIREIFATPLARTTPYARQGLLIALDKNIGNQYPSGLFFVLSLVAPVTVVGIAKIALQLGTLPQSFLLPQVGELSTTVLANMSADIKVLRKNAARVIKHTLFFHLLLSVGAFVIYPFAIPLVYSKSYGPALITPTLWIIVLSLLMPLTIINSPLLRLFRKIHWSAILTVVTFLLMWTTMFVGATIMDPLLAFMAAYLIGQVLPLLLTATIFRTLLAKPHD